MFTVDYKHRSWNHICWAANFKSNEHTLFYNGKKVGTKALEKENSIKSFQGYPNQTKQFLVFGQEPDEFKGGFTKDSLFEGKMSRFNWWDHQLDDNLIGIKDQFNSFSCKKKFDTRANYIKEYIEEHMLQYC